MDLTRLMKENVTVVGEVPYVPSKRITDAEGNPQEWLIRPLSNDEIEAINERHTSKLFNPKNGQPAGVKQDREKIIEDMMLTALVSPSRADLEQAELQDSWGVHSPYGVLTAMLLPGELSDLGSKIQEVSGYEPLRFNELVEEVEKK